MLTALQVRNIVLIEALDLTFGPGLTALTGETGAGKSILLDALGLAAGARADRALVRQGANEGSVTAVFELEPGHAAERVLEEAGREPEPVLLLRRTLGADGRSRAFVNDAPASVTLLKRLGDTVLDVHGQHADRLLLEPQSHRQAVDRYAQNGELRAKTARAYEALDQAREALAAHRTALERSDAEADYLRAALEELSALAPAVGEEARLAEERALEQASGKVLEELETLEKALGEGRVEQALNAGLRRMERLPEAAVARLAPVRAALDRVLVELSEAERALGEAIQDFAFDPARLDAAEERLFALRQAARKHRATVDALPDIRARFETELAALEAGQSHADGLERAVEQALGAYRETALALRESRKAAAQALDGAVAGELPALKLEKARLRTTCEALGEADAARHGLDRVEFEVATNPGAPFGPLQDIASGGEMARLGLALKVVTGAGGGRVLVFDEVDQGVGGAVAAAVGERLARLAAGPGAQVLVVTHSPQVAAAAGRHLKIAKGETDAVMRTDVGELEPGARAEEIARMLSGARVTAEARAAAERLLKEAGRAPAAKRAKRAGARR